MLFYPVLLGSSHQVNTGNKLVFVLHLWQKQQTLHRSEIYKNKKLIFLYFLKTKMLTLNFLFIKL